LALPHSTETMGKILAISLLLLTAFINLTTDDMAFYSRLGESFLDGKLYYTTLPKSGVMDTAIFNGRYYSPFGLFPALVSVPFVWMGYYHQGQLNFLLILTIFYAVFAIAERLSYSRSDCWWIALAFCFGTSFVDAAFSTWHIAHTWATLFLVLAVYEYLGSRRPWLIGLLLGLATASRSMAGLSVICFGVLFLWHRQVIRFGLPFVAIAGAIAVYNFFRFQSPIEAGYTYQIYSAGVSHATWNAPGNIAGPALSLAHIPINLKTLVFGFPSREAVGVSMFLMSPFLIYLLSGKRWEPIDWLLLGNVALIALSFLAFRSTGWRQMGYRYTVDFMPLLFWLLLRRRAELTKGFEALILAAVVIDLAMVGYFIFGR
jgi:hypothetical protein